jgi:hypothetical protein
MKMRKSTWLLLVLALAAILLVAGCSPTTPPNGEEPNGEEPTPPPADKECPKPVKTVVSKIYDTTGKDQNFQIKITFNEDFNSSCIEDPASWTIEVENPDRAGTPTVTKQIITVDGKVVTVKARVEEAVTYRVKYETETETETKTKTETKTFPGLICNKADAEAYATGYTLPEGAILVSSTPAEPTHADKVTWKLECAVYDDLGNVCCDFEGEACCVEPYCEECPEDWCDLAEPGACL